MMIFYTSSCHFQNGWLIILLFQDPQIYYLQPFFLAIISRFNVKLRTLHVHESMNIKSQFLAYFLRRSRACTPYTTTTQPRHETRHGTVSFSFLFSCRQASRGIGWKEMKIESKFSLENPAATTKNFDLSIELFEHLLSNDR